MSSVDPNSITPEMLGTLLQNIFCPNTEIIKKATEILKQYFKLPICINPLLSYATTCSDTRLRLLACISLRKRIKVHWEAQDASFKATIKTTLLNTFIAESDTKIKENLAYLIGTLGSLLVPNNEWPELFGFIVSKCQSANAGDVEQAMLLLYAICEKLGSALENYLSSILEILNKLIHVENINIQILAIKTIEEIMLSNITVGSLSKVVELIPQMLQTMVNLESNSSFLHELFDKLVELLDVQGVLIPHLPLLLNKALAISANPNNSNDLRIVTLTFVQMAIESNSKTIRKDKDLIVKILETAFTVCKEDEEKFDEDDETPTDAALDLIEQYAFKFQNKVIYPLIISGCETFLKSSDPLARRAALLILGTASKGIESVLKKNLESVLNVLLQCSGDADIRVQEACIMAISFLVDNLSFNTFKYHSKIIPLLTTEMENKPEKVRTRAFYALQAFCGNLNQKEILPYLKLLLHSLLTYLNDQKMYCSCYIG